MGLVIVAVIFLSGLGDHGWLHRLGVDMFGPPSVVMAEAYTEAPPTPAVTFDHTVLDALLRAHVDPDGWVDYEALAADTSQLDAYIATLADAPFDALGRDEKLALLINAYNAFTLRLILDHYPIDSIRDIPDAERWDAVRWELAGETYSLNQIEHEQVRAHFKEPRIHFALVCAAYSCPKLRNEAYTGAGLEAQLSDQTAYTHSHDRWLQFDQADNTLHLTALYDWYGGDFKAVADSVLDYVAEQVPAVRSAIDAGHAQAIRWLDYDWKLNDISNKP
jgi:hypothetical protein